MKAVSTRVNIVARSGLRLSHSRGENSFREKMLKSFTAPSSTTPTGLVLGLYCDEDDTSGTSMKFTQSGQKYDQALNGTLKRTIKNLLPLPKLGQVRVLYGLDDKYSAIAVVGMGTDCLSFNPEEGIDEQKEVIRQVSAIGCKTLQELQLQKIVVESFGHAESSAEGSLMSVWKNQDSLPKEQQVPLPKVELYDCSDNVGWTIGETKASAQNLARQLMEAPSNLMTPSTFALNAVEVLTQSGVNAEAKVSNWSKTRHLNAMLAISKGSCQSPMFLEANYEGCEPDIAPVVLVGSGLTFNSGGLTVRDCLKMNTKGVDIGGAAAVVAALRAIAQLRIPINARGLVPLCENMPGSHAFCPGDVIIAQNGRSVLVQNTSDVGALITSDALCHSSQFNPKFIMDLGTISVDTAEALGSAASAVFTKSDTLYETLQVASIHTGDRVWRLPFVQLYANDIKDTEKYDLLSVGTTPYGGACKNAAFLEEFVPAGCECLHVDTSGVAYTQGSTYPYLSRGMTGRPTRTIIEFLSQLVCKSE